MAKRMISIGHDGSLYDDISGDFHKPPRSNGMFLEFDDLKREKSRLLLNTPDSRAFPLSTPDVATLLSSCGTTVTTNTPTSSRFLRPTAPVTAEQEMYAQGFLDALDQLHHDPMEENGEPATKSNTNSPPPSVILHTHSANELATTHGLTTTHTHVSASDFDLPADHSLATVAPTYVTATMDYIPNIPPPSPHSAYADSSTRVHVHADFAANSSQYPVMNEYSHPGAASYNFSSGQSGSGSNNLPGFGQISSPMNPQLLRELQAMVPADMKTMETMKVERKKARNRIAASKCRVRRLQRESDLQGKVRMLKDHNQELNNELNELKEQILNLKKALLQHMQTGCQVNLPEGFRTKLDSISSE